MQTVTNDKLAAPMKTAAEDAEGKETVLMLFPHPLNLTISYARRVLFKEGPQEVDKQLLDIPHVAKTLEQHGVKPYEKPKLPDPEAQVVLGEGAARFLQSRGYAAIKTGPQATEFYKRLEEKLRLPFLADLNNWLGEQLTLVEGKLQTIQVPSTVPVPDEKKDPSDKKK